MAKVSELGSGEVRGAVIGEAEIEALSPIPTYSLHPHKKKYIYTHIYLVKPKNGKQMETMGKLQNKPLHAEP